MSGEPPTPSASSSARSGLINFSRERQRHERFVGRQKVLAQLDQWLLAEDSDRWVVVTGGPGMGKSALLAAWLARREAAGAVVPHHFIRRGQYDWDDPAKLVASLIAQLVQRFPSSKEAEGEAQMHPAARLASMLERVSASELAPHHDRLVLLIDGLDEYDPPTATPGADPLAAFLPSTLPRGVSVLCASRPRHPYLDRLAARDGELKQLDLDDVGCAADNEETVRAFWEREAPQLGLDAKFIAEAVERATGNLQHAETLRKHLVGLPQDRRRVEVIPRGLAALLDSAWERLATDPVVVEGLGILCAAREALTLDELGAVASWTAEAQRRAFVRGARELLIETQRAEAVPEYRLHHDSIRAHVATAIGSAALHGHHRALAQKLATWPAPREAAARRYALRHALTHRAEAGEWTDAWRLAADLGFLEAKCRELGAHEAEADVARAAERCRASGDELIRERFEDLARVMGRESHWLREAPEATAALVWNDLRRSGWSTEALDQQLKLPAGARFLRLRHLATRESPALMRDLVGHTSTVTACAVTPDGRRVVSASFDQTLRVWDLDSGRLLASLLGHTDSVTACAVTPDGRRVVSASYDQTLKVWDLDSGRLLASLLEHTKAVTACAVTPDGRRVVSASNDKTLKLWDLDSGRLLASLLGHTDSVTACAVTPDGHRVVSASADRTLKLWDLDSGRLLASLLGHTDSVTACAVTPDGHRVVSASYDQTLKVWDLDSGRLLASLLGHTAMVAACAMAPDGRRVVSASYDQTLKVWDLDSGRLLASLLGHTAWVTACAVTRDDRRVVSASDDQTLKVWDLDSGRPLASLLGHTAWVTACVMPPDGRRVVSASYDQTLKVWDLDSGRLLTSLQGHTDFVIACAVTPDGQRVVSASWDQTLKVWDLDSSRLLTSLLGHTAWVTVCAVTPDGRRVVSASHDQTLKVWDLDSGRLLTSLQGHTDSVTACAVTPDGRRVVSASDDQTLKVWDLDSGRLLASLQGHTAFVTACAVTPDGRRVVSASYDQTLKVWDLESGACLYTHRANTYLPAVATTESTIIAGDAAGRVWFLDWPAPHRRDSPDVDANKPILAAEPGGAIVNADGTSPTHAVFVIHADVPAETAFVRSELVPALQLAPDQLLFSSELPLGQTIIDALENGVVSSRVTILVLSPTSLHDTWAAFGETLASYIAATGGTLVPLLLADCQLPPRLSLRVQLDCRDPQKRPDAFRRLRALVASALPTAENAPPIRPTGPGSTSAAGPVPAQQGRPATSPAPSTNVDIGILTIRDDEFRAVLDVFPSKAGIAKGKSREYALRRADAGNGQQYTIAVLCQIEQGNGEAQDAARDLLDDLAPRLVLVVGIAGGLPSDDVKLGDVILSTRIQDFTVGARKTGQAPTYAAAGGPIAKALAAAIANLPAREDELGDWTSALPSPPEVKWSRKGQLYGSQKWQSELRAKLEHHHGKSSTPRGPIYKIGPIASSDCLVKDPALAIRWLTTARNLLAIEMESGGVFRAVRERCPMLAIRGISDIIGLKRADDWTKYACASAAAFARAFLQTRPVPVGASLPDPS